ncbi:MAG: hypothetical protein ACRDD7_13015 [Peptostreptococcaceae bacterium]
MRDIKITRACVIANMHRVIEILESNKDLKPTWESNKEFAELKSKMHEIRRDTIDIEKALKY